MKILIVHAYAGIGHKKAAEALYNAFLGHKDIETSIVDVLDWTNPFFRYSYPKVYLFLINKVPLLWGMLYYFFDNSFVDTIAAPLRRIFHSIEAKRFIGYILREKPDVVLCTHFLPAEVLSGLKKKGLYKGKLITVVTDFLPHAFWIARHSDYFIGAIERTERELVKRGVRKDKIRILGIPHDLRFGMKKDKEELVNQIVLEKGVFTVLIMGGGFGTGPVKRIVESIASLKSGIQVIVICGKNKKLHKELNYLKQRCKIGLNVFGYQDNIDEFMEVSDCLVTKSGGLTVSESLSKRLPMIIIKPIPGQETRNCSVLIEYGVAVRADSIRDVKRHIIDFMSTPDKINNMRTRINSLAYPDAADRIAEFVLGGGTR